MGVWQRLASVLGLRRSAPEDPRQSTRIAFHPRTPAGVHVDEDTALTYSAVWACVRVISDTVAHLPWRVRIQTPNGSELLPGHPTDRLLRRRPNDECGPFVFRQFLLQSALLWGNGYAEIERDASMRPVALWPLMPDRVVPERTSDGIVYRIRSVSTGGEVVIAGRDMFHLVGPYSLDGGLSGVSPIRYAARTIGLGIAAEGFGAMFFGNGAHPGGVLEHPGTLSEAAVKNLRDSFADNYSRGQAMKPLVLEEGMKWHTLTIPPEDAQFLETRRFNVVDICRWFGVPPHKVADLERATYSNIEHQAIEFVQDSVLPWVKRLEEEADYKLISSAAPNVFTHVSVQGLLRGDNKSRAEFYRAMFDMGVMSPNDVRELEDMNRIGPDGDKHLVQMNLTTLDRVGEVEATTHEAEGNGAAESPPNGDDMEARVH